MQQQAIFSTALQHEFTVPLFTTHRVLKEVRDWQMASDASPAQTIEIGNRSKLVGKANCNRCRGELQPIKPTADFDTTTCLFCGWLRGLTASSFQPYLTIPVRLCTAGRLMPPARSRWPIAVSLHPLRYATTSHIQYRSTT